MSKIDLEFTIETLELFKLMNGRLFKKELTSVQKENQLHLEDVIYVNMFKNKKKITLEKKEFETLILLIDVVSKSFIHLPSDAENTEFNIIKQDYLKKSTEVIKQLKKDGILK